MLALNITFAQLKLQKKKKSTFSSKLACMQHYWPRHVGLGKKNPEGDNGKEIPGERGGWGPGPTIRGWGRGESAKFGDSGGGNWYPGESKGKGDKLKKPGDGNGSWEPGEGKGGKPPPRGEGIAGGCSWTGGRAWTWGCWVGVNPDPSIEFCK